MEANKSPMSQHLLLNMTEKNADAYYLYQVFSPLAKLTILADFSISHVISKVTVKLSVFLRIIAPNG
jgi:hypothetical protein